MASVQLHTSGFQVVAQDAEKLKFFLECFYGSIVRTEVSKQYKRRLKSLSANAHREQA